MVSTGTQKVMGIEKAVKSIADLDRVTRQRFGVDDRYGGISLEFEPDRTEKASVDRCNLYGKDLTFQDALESSNERFIEDIPDVIEKTEIIKVVQVKNIVMIAKKISPPNLNWHCLRQILG